MPGIGPLRRTPTGGSSAAGLKPQTPGQSTGCPDDVAVFSELVKVRQPTQSNNAPVLLSATSDANDEIQAADFGSLDTTPPGRRDMERVEALLQSILATIPNAVMVVDERGGMQSFSAAAASLFGYTCAEMTDQNLSLLLPPPDMERNGCQFATNARHAIGIGRRKDGSAFPIELTIERVDLPGMSLSTVLVRDLTGQAERGGEPRESDTELGRLVQHLATARDVADRSIWTRSRFLAGISHEIRAPLNGILGYAQLLRMEGGLSGAQSGRIDRMFGAGKDLLQMISRMFDPSAVDVENVELQVADVDVLAVATECLELIRPAAEAKHLALSITRAPSTRHVLATDPARLRQVMLNLLGNAVKFTNQGAVELRLRSVAGGSVLRIAVADTGPGIPAKERRRLFQNIDGFDIDSARAITGAGLALSSRLATLMGGSLGHHNKPGGGSVFWLQLPLDSIAASTPAMLPTERLTTGQPFAGVHGEAELGAALETAGVRTEPSELQMPMVDQLEAMSCIGGEDMSIAGPTVHLSTEPGDQASIESHLPGRFDRDGMRDADSESSMVEPVHCGNVGVPLQPPTASIPASPPLIGAELPVCNLTVFDRTALYLAPEVVASSLSAIAERGEALLRGLRRPDALMQIGDELAEAAHTIAGSAGRFGFERLTAVTHYFGRAVQARALEAPAVADGLIVALEVTLHTIHDRARIPAEA
jgi:PAS domain S-box-containing protein